MALAQRKPNPGPGRSSDGMKGLLDLFSRNPTPARVVLHVERLLAGWREALEPDAYAERLDALRAGLVDGIALTEDGAADIDPASKTEARQAAVVLTAMRTAYQATKAGQAAELLPT